MKASYIAAAALACASIAACETSTTVKVAARIAEPVDRDCIISVSIRKYGEESLILPKDGHSFPIGIDFALHKQARRVANVYQRSSPAYGTILEIELAWWGNATTQPVEATRQQEKELLLEMLGECSANKTSFSAIECTVSRGRRSETGCGPR